MRRMTDALVVGAGPAGLAAAVALKKNGVSNLLVVEREEQPGGVLNQCIHPGFGIHLYNEDLTGPEYAERAIAAALAHDVEILSRTAALDLARQAEGFEAVLLSEERGLVVLQARAVILAMGCRERNRGNLNIPGARVAGILTAGLAQRLVNLEGCLPGREIVILGSGDIGLIMARRLSLEGAYVKAVVEMQPFPGGLARNVVQCLNDFHIPLYLSHTVTRITGEKRIGAVEITPVDDRRVPENRSGFSLSCDTLLLSAGLIPENELARKAGALINEVTNGPVVDDRLMTSMTGLFACGNVLHVHDVADFVSQEAEEAGISAARFLLGSPQSSGRIPVRAGDLVRYVLPALADPAAQFTLNLRPMAPVEDISLFLRYAGVIIYREYFRKILPSAMIRLPAGSFSLPAPTPGPGPSPPPAGDRPALEVFFSKEKL